MNGLGTLKNILILGERVWAGMAGFRKLLILLPSDADEICGSAGFVLNCPVPRTPVDEGRELFERFAIAFPPFGQQCSDRRGARSRMTGQNDRLPRLADSD